MADRRTSATASAEPVPRCQQSSRIGRLRNFHQPAVQIPDRRNRSGGFGRGVGKLLLNQRDSLGLQDQAKLPRPHLDVAVIRAPRPRPTAP